MEVPHEKVHKSIFFISLVLIAAFVCVSFFGIYTTYGEVTTTVVRGARELVYDRDLNDSGIIVLKAADTSAAALENAKNVVTHRLAALGYSDFDVRAAADGSGLIITSPFETSRASVLTSLAKLLVQPGKLEIRVGNETDSDGKPTGVSETVIADSTMIRGGKLTYESSPIYTIYGVRISLTKAGRQALKAATGEMLETVPPARFPTGLTAKRSAPPVSRRCSTSLPSPSMTAARAATPIRMSALCCLAPVRWRAALRRPIPFLPPLTTLRPCSRVC